MSRIVLVLLWHMHQPDYRDPATGDYLLPWTRLHALKDYTGMVTLLDEFPAIHATFNLTPILLCQLESYASGNFHEPLFEVVFKPADQLTREDREQLLARVFPASENLLRRFARLRELRERARSATARRLFSRNDWVDLQVLSQLAWMDPFHLERDPVLHALAARGRQYSETDKQALRIKEVELASQVIPAYRAAAARGQVELSTTPMYHPILPLLIDTDVAREANPRTKLPRRRFAYPEDARVHLERALRLHARLFGAPPAGLWPAEGGVSSAVAELAAGFGLHWLATGEGVLARSLEAAGIAFSPEHRYRPYRLETPAGPVHLIFRDHQLSDLVGFVYAKLDPNEAADDLHRRIHQAADPLLAAGRDALVAIILDGENAWEFYRDNGRPFLRAFYRHLSEDPRLVAVTVSEALAGWADAPPLSRLVPGSWINANFDVWIGHPEDHRAWELLAEARAFYAQRAAAGQASAEQLAAAYEALLVAESSDWCWWFGPEHQSAQDADFDNLFRKNLSQVYRALGTEPPDELTVPIKRGLVRAIHHGPTGYIQPAIDGRVTNYFEWLGAGLYAAEHRSGTMHAQRFYLKELHYGFDESNLYVRVDFSPQVLEEIRAFELRLVIKTVRELRIHARVEGGRLVACEILQNGAAQPATARSPIEVHLGNVFELRLPREWVELAGRKTLELTTSFWGGGLPLDVLPAEGWLEIGVTEEGVGWRGV